MSLVGTEQVFLGGFLGGVALELLHWYGLRRRSTFPKYVRSAFYWMLTIGMAALGGVLSVFYFGANADALIAFHVGISAPLILQKLASTAAKPPGAKGNETSGIRQKLRHISPRGAYGSACEEQSRSHWRHQNGRILSA